ncbi:MAG TPA: hypothetical protein VFN89_07790 [Solirubrobacterales bacterium]|nr:hypothetical protein [Solirubrobacterales bacterium]
MRSGVARVRFTVTSGLAQAALLARYDVARRTVRISGLTRYIVLSHAGRGDSAAR